MVILLPEDANPLDGYLSDMSDMSEGLGVGVNSKDQLPENESNTTDELIRIDEETAA